MKTLHLSHRQQFLNALRGNNHCFSWESYMGVSKSSWNSVVILWNTMLPSLIAFEVHPACTHAHVCMHTHTHLGIFGSTRRKPPLEWHTVHLLQCTLCLWVLQNIDPEVPFLVQGEPKVTGCEVWWIQWLQCECSLIDLLHCHSRVTWVVVVVQNPSHLIQIICSSSVTLACAVPYEIPNSFTASLMVICQLACTSPFTFEIISIFTEMEGLPLQDLALSSSRLLLKSLYQSYAAVL